MKSSFRLFRIAGIDIGIHFTWIFIFVFFSWSLAEAYFPSSYPGFSTWAYWVTGIVATIFIFVSVLVHEMAHSLVARSRGLPVNSITLFILGGVSNLEEEPDQPSVEFNMAIVGPVTSIVLAIVFWIITSAVMGRVIPISEIFMGVPGATLVTAVIAYLAVINLFLGAFNLIPGFPLDGGRVLRSIIWGSTGNLAKATNIAGIVGQAFGWILILLGIFFIFWASLFTGLWLAFIGWFLNSSADASRKEIALKERLSVVKVRDLIGPEPETIDPQTTITEMVANVFNRHHGRAVPVCKDGQLMGIVTISDVKGIPQERWSSITVEQIMTREPLYTVSPEDNVYTALKIVTQHNINQVLIKQDDRCAGLLSRADIINHLQYTQELGIRK
jgi:Zn-dependent protease/CBS domain-containing protein